MNQRPSVYEELSAIVTSVGSHPEFRDIEVLKSYVRRAGRAYVLGLVVDRDGGVDTDLCEAVSRYIIRRADALVPPVDYQVEVSSAGLDRPLITAGHYRRYEGKVAKVITTLRIANRTEFTGAIGSVTDEAVTIHDPHAGPTPIPFAVIKRASLVYDPAQDLKRKK